MADSTSGLIPGYTKRRYASAEEVHANYPQIHLHRLSLAEKLATFTDPSAKTYDTECIADAYLVGCGEGRNQTWKEKFHRGIAPIMEQIFREILAAGLDYTIKSLHCYSFRYVKDSIKGAWLHHPDYAGLSPGEGCNLTYAERDRELGRMHVPIDGEISAIGRRVERFDKLSDHAYGSAIDINGRDNQFENAGWCDIHPEIVRIFQNHKFFWGGYFNSRRDYMHFEYGDTELDIADETRKSFSFPIKLGSGKNPALYYDNNESTAHMDIHMVDDTEASKKVNDAADQAYKKEQGKKKPDPNAKAPEHVHLKKEALIAHTQTTEGGFYPLALPSGGKTFLHGGIHLASVRHGELVTAMAPGTIMAVRMAVLENESTNKSVHQSLRNWNNFVLVRHEVSPSGKDKYYPLYSLYMHLAGFDLPALGNGPASQKLTGPLAEIPWLRSLYLGRFGVLIRVSDAGAPAEDIFPLGTCLWPAQSMDDVDGKSVLRAKALSLDGSTLFEIPVRSDEDSDKKFTRWWEWKPPSPHLKNLWADIKEGKIATFDRAFLPVKAGDPIGHTKNFPDQEFDPLVGTDGTKYQILPRLIHWEIFGVKDKGVVDGLVEKLEEASEGAIDAAHFAPITSDAPAALYSGTDIAQNFPKDSAPKRAAKLPEDLAPGDLLEMFNAGAQEGAPIQVRFELRHLMEPSKCFPVRKEHVFRLTPVRKQKDSLIPTGSPCLMKISDTQAKIEWDPDDPTVKPGTCKEEPGPTELPDPVDLTPEHWNHSLLKPESVPKTVDFFVPAPLNTEKLLLEKVSEGVQLGTRETKALEQDFDRFKTLTGRQWRNVLLNHASDWVPASNKEQMSDGVGKATPPGSLAWWDPQAEFPAFGSKTKLFGGVLPADGNVQNLHPVTMKWLLELLQNDRLARMAEVATARAEEEKAKQASLLGALAPKGKSKEKAGKTKEGKLETKPPHPDDVFPLFKDPLARSGPGVANSVVDPVGVGILVRDEKVRLDQQILLVLADDLYRVMDPENDPPMGEVVLEQQPDAPPSAPIPNQNFPFTPKPEPSLASTLLSRPASSFTLDALKEEATDSVTDFGRTTFKDAARSLKDRKWEPFNSEIYANDPEVKIVDVKEEYRFPVRIGGTGIGATEVGADFWGRWKIYPMKDKHIGNTQKWGLETIEVPKPDFGEMAGYVDLLQVREGEPHTYTWTLPWTLLALRSGFRVLVELVCIQGGERKRTGLCVPGYSLPGKDPDSQLLDSAKWIQDAEYIQCPTPKAIDEQKASGAPAPKGKKSKGPPPLMITSHYSWNEIFAAFPKKGRIHNRLLRALNDLAKLCKSDYKLLSIDPDGNGCVIAATKDIAAAVHKVDAFRTFLPLTGAEKDKTKKYRLTIPSFASGKIEFAFSPKAVLEKVFVQDHPEWLGSDISFDLHFVRGFGRNGGYQGCDVLCVPKEVPEGTVVTRSYPLAVTRFDRAFGSAWATPNWTKTSAKKNAPCELSWAIDVDLLGEPSLWQAGDVQMRLCGKAAIIGQSVDNTPWQSAIQMGARAHAKFTKGKSKVDGFLKTGKYTLELKFIPKVAKSAKSSVPTSKKGLLDDLRSAVSNMGNDVESEDMRNLDLTPFLGEPSVAIDGYSAVVSVPTTGLFTSNSSVESDGVPPQEVSGICRVELLDANGAAISGLTENGIDKLPDPDQVLRWQLRLPAGEYTCRIMPPSPVRDTAVSQRTVKFTIASQEQP